MTELPHRQAPIQGGNALPNVGRAHRLGFVDGGELWRLPEGATGIAERLLALGREGVGGFVDGGRDDVGPWLRRRPLGETLRGHWPEQPGTIQPVLDLFTALCTAVAHCEERSIFPGMLSPRSVWVDADAGTAGLCADVLVAGLLGEAAATSTGGRLTRWTPPEQAGGAPWDNAANRYVIGLMLYRALAGTHPFSDKGLRLELAERSGRGAPPMPETIAATLPPGLQSFVLRMLDADPNARPPSAREIGERLAQFIVQARGTAKPVAVRPAVSAPIHPTPPSSPSPPPALGAVRAASGSPRRGRLLHWLLGVVPLGLGAVTAAVVGSREGPPPIAVTQVRVGPTAPLPPSGSRPDDCGACHPEQAAQWQGSVMAHSVRSPLFGALEILIEEQAGRDFDCPEGAGVLRPATAGGACRDPTTGLSVTGSGGELWCVNCHAPGSNLDGVVPRWDGRGRDARSRQPLPDLLPASSLDGVSCVFCHSAHGPVGPKASAQGEYVGNPDWRSTTTGQIFSARPEDRQGLFGIGNSGYALDPFSFFIGAERETAELVPGGAHLRPTDAARAYVKSSQFCGACHDVRLFGTDAIEGVRKGEHFKRLRNAYSEWADWAATERAAGREAASCQDCHMSAYPGICVPDDTGGLASSFGATGATALQRACPQGTRFEARPPGSRTTAAVATSSAGPVEISSHAFTGVDLPLAPEFPAALLDDPSLDAAGVPRGAKQRRDLLLGSTFRFAVGSVRRSGGRVEIPIEIENIGAGHKVPAGFSQEREFWVHLRVTDEVGRVLYEVGRVDREDEDLHDKTFVRVNVDDRFVDGQGRPLGVFGANVVDGPDVGRWEGRFGTFRGQGLVNLQNGFLRCVSCIGEIDGLGRCQPARGQGRHRADRFTDGQYDLETGECVSNLVGDERFLEVYFPVGGLDAERGVTKGPDAIIDSRSALPGVTQRYTYELDLQRAGELRIEARLMFRSFPPFLIKAFAEYEALAARRGRRPSGPLVTTDMMERLEIVELHREVVAVP